MDLQESQSTNTAALDRLINREEVLQICFWFQGEGFGDVFDATSIQVFLSANLSSIEAAFDELVDDGDLVPVPETLRKYKFSASGTKKGGRLFADSFAEFQNAGHGECAAGCCDDDDHSRCGDHCALS